jgi:hypothetical protein
MRRAMPLLLGLVNAGLLTLSLSPLAFARPYSGTGVPFVSLVHTASSANTYYNYTVLNEDPIFNDPNAEVFVAASWNPNNACGCVYDTHALMVWYFGNTWVILHEDGTPLSLGTTYNVFATYAHHFNNSPQDVSFVHIATAGNSTGSWTTLDDSSLNYNPYAVIVVTQNWTPPGQQGGVFNDRQVGVWYDGSHWAIFNEDSAPIPPGAAFNVFVVSATAPWAFSQRATSSSYVDEINNGYTNYQPSLLLFVTPNFDPAGNCPCAFDNHPLGVYYDYNHEWSVYHQDIANMAVGEAFNIFAFAPSS